MPDMTWLVHTSLRASRWSAGPVQLNPIHPTTMSTSEKPKGPASYFPSIETKYGHPIEHWLQLARAMDGMKHMERVARLKADHGLGHGHANAIVAYVSAEAKDPADTSSLPAD